MELLSTSKFLNFARCKIILQGGCSNLYSYHNSIKLTDYSHPQKHSVLLNLNLQQGSKVYFTISCWEVEFVEFWVLPLRISLHSCSLVSQHEFRPSHCGRVSCFRKQCLTKYLSKICILDSQRWSLLYSDQISGLTRAPLQERRNIFDWVKCLWPNQW